MITECKGFLFVVWCAHSAKLDCHFVTVSVVTLFFKRNIYSITLMGEDHIQVGKEYAKW